MGIEAFIWNYRDGEPIGFDYATVLEILSTDQTEPLNEYGFLRVWFQEPNDVVDIHLGRDAADSGHVSGIMVSRPIRHPAFLERLLRVLGLGDVMLFYSDETTPVFRSGADAGHYPADLLAELGEPRYVNTPQGLIQQEP